MRKELLYNPLLLAERIGEQATRIRRFRKLKNTVASGLTESQITSLEFLESAKANYTIKTIYDIGANEGAWTLLAKAIIPEAGIYAFEPLPQYQKQYQENSKSLSGIKLHPVGVGPVNRLAAMNVAGHASSFLEIGSKITELYGQKKVGTQEVQVIALDDYVQRQQLPWPDLMKLDIEGYELEALKGASHCMQHSKALILEVSFVERHIDQPLFPEVTYFLSQHGFRIGSFMVNMPLGCEVIQADVYYVKNN